MAAGADLEPNIMYVHGRSYDETEELKTMTSITLYGSVSKWSRAT